MTEKQLAALDIYTYIHRVFFGSSPSEREFRMNWGSNGCVKKVLNYINDTYLKENKDGDIHNE